jgi:glycyl-tRNA synthetase
MKPEHLRAREHEKEELPHYSNGTTDFEYKFPFGWGELSSTSSRTDFDLKQHMNLSGEDLQYIDQETNERYIPYVIEPSLGADRVTLAFMLDAYEEEVINENDTRTVMRFHPALAPIKAAILPLSKKLREGALSVFQELSKDFMVDYDESGSIGKRYRRQDEIGTPFCITYDFDSEEDGKVTVRDRDTMEQVRVSIAELPALLKEKLRF